MNLEEYLRKVKEIHEQMKGIADRTAHMANGGEVAMTNPNFAETMNKFHQLLTQLINLDSQYPGSSK